MHRGVALLPAALLLSAAAACLGAPTGSATPRSPCPCARPGFYLAVDSDRWLRGAVGLQHHTYLNLYPALKEALHLGRSLVVPRAPNLRSQHSGQDLRRTWPWSTFYDLSDVDPVSGSTVEIIGNASLGVAACKATVGACLAYENEPGPQAAGLAGRVVVASDARLDPDGPERGAALLVRRTDKWRYDESGFERSAVAAAGSYRALTSGCRVHLKPSRMVMDAAVRALRFLGTPDVFVTKVRRGDLLDKDYIERIGLKTRRGREGAREVTAAGNVIDELYASGAGPRSLVYVATNERDLSHFDPLRGHFREVLFAKDVPPLSRFVAGCGEVGGGRRLLGDPPGHARHDGRAVGPGGHGGRWSGHAGGVPVGEKPPLASTAAHVPARGMRLGGRGERWVGPARARARDPARIPPGSRPDPAQPAAACDNYLLFAAEMALADLVRQELGAHRCVDVLALAGRSDYDGRNWPSLWRMEPGVREWDKAHQKKPQAPEEAQKNSGFRIQKKGGGGGGWLRPARWPSKGPQKRGP